MAAPRAPVSIHPDTSVGGRHARGFTLVELVIALVILLVGVLGLASTTVHVVRRAVISDLITERVTARRSVLEMVQGLNYDSIDAGTDTTGRFVVSWSIAHEESTLKELAVVTVGPGSVSGNGVPAGTIRPDVSDTITYRIGKP